MCVWVSVCVHVSEGVLGMQKRLLDSPEAGVVQPHLGVRDQTLVLRKNTK